MSVSMGAKVSTAMVYCDCAKLVAGRIESAIDARKIALNRHHMLIVSRRIWVTAE
jgi:hypothetical protein